MLQPPDEGTEVVPVPPEDLLHVERLVGIAVPIPPPWGFGGVRGDPPSLPSPMFAPQDCSNTWCQELSCRLGRLERGGGVSVQLLRTLHDSFFSRVSKGEACGELGRILGEGHT